MRVAMPSLLLASRFWSACVILAVAMSLFWAGICLGQLENQEYEVMPYADKYVIPEEEEVDDDPYDINDRKKPKTNASRQVERLRKDDKTKAVDGLRSGRVAEAEAYTKEFLIPQMTHQGQFFELGTLRKDFLDRFLGLSSGQTRKTFIEQTCLPTLKTIVEGNYHPAARLNAVLLIGGFNDVDADSSSRTAPLPNPQSVKYLLSLIESIDTPEFVRVGAMTGLHRVANIEFAQKRSDAGDVARIYQFALATLQGSAPGQDSWSKEVAYWLQRRSAQILGFLKNKGAGNEAVVALQNVLTKDDQELLLRQDAMIALRELGVDGDNARATIDAVIAMAAALLEEEAKSLRGLMEEYVTISMLLDDSYLIDNKSFQKTGGSRGDKPGVGQGGLEGGDEDAGPVQKQAGKKQSFDLPNHALNTVRRSLKSSLFHFHKTLSSEALLKGLNPDELNRVRRARRIIEAAIRDTDIGLVDLSKPEATTPYDEELKEKTVSELMYDKFMALSSQLKALKKTD
jgi:hypothetical protein